MTFVSLIDGAVKFGASVGMVVFFVSLSHLTLKAVIDKQQKQIDELKRELESIKQDR